MTLLVIFQVLIRVLESQKPVVEFQNFFWFWVILGSLKKKSESEMASVLAISFLKTEESNSSFIFRSTMKAFIYFSRRSQQDRGRGAWCGSPPPRRRVSGSNFVQETKNKPFVIQVFNQIRFSLLLSLSS
jgi:hypothetical protein